MMVLVPVLVLLPLQLSSPPTSSPQIHDPSCMQRYVERALSQICSLRRCAQLVQPPSVCYVDRLFAFPLA